MTAERVTRAEFKAAIEAGIASAPDLNIEERNALRLVALSATEALVGIFYADNCGCPLTQAGLFVRPNAYPDEETAERRRPFYRGYDDAFPGVDKVKVID